MIYAADQIPVGNRVLKIGDECTFRKFIVESIDIEHPGKCFGEAVLQIDFSGPQPGDWFLESDFIHGENGFRRWVITEVSQPYAAPTGYSRANIKFHRAPNATD